MKDLSHFNKHEKSVFLSSFDTIFCDIDGTLWNSSGLIPGADAAITILKNLRKKVIFVSNKTTEHYDVYYQRLKSNFNLEKPDLIVPALAIVSHLKKIGFKKEIYLLGMGPLRRVLEEEGFKVFPEVRENFGEFVEKYFKLSLEKNSNVGAVVTDLDVNINRLKMNKAVTFLQNPDVIFVSGNSTNKFLNMSSGERLINSWYFDWVFEDFTGRKALRLAKPTREFNDFIKEKHEIGDPSRVLVIGDSIHEDMAFATNCGYKKLLVLSGMTQKEDISALPEKFQPDYFVDNLGTFADIFEK